MNIGHLVVPQLKVFTIMLCSGAERWLKPLNLSYFKKKKKYMTAGLAYTLKQNERIRISKNNNRISIKYRSCQINVKTAASIDHACTIQESTSQL